jgi:hypothetical protein
MSLLFLERSLFLNVSNYTSPDGRFAVPRGVIEDILQLD